jgi:hypothetical protein
MAKQIESTGQAVAQLRMDFLHAAENQPPSPTDSDTTIDSPFYTRPKVAASAPKGRPAATFRNAHTTDRANHKGFIPKMNFPKFSGKEPSIWKDKCEDYFKLLNIPESMWTTAASLHMDGNAESWMQVYKLKEGLGSWQTFIKVVQHKFGAYDYQHAIDEMWDLQQTDTMEEYANAFETLQYQITMHDLGMGDAYFISQFIKGLKPEIRYPVQGQVPHTMERAVRLAKIQETIQEKAKSKGSRGLVNSKQAPMLTGKWEPRAQGVIPAAMTKERQLRDFCRANSLCYFCREPYDATHAAKCSKRPKAQANALVLNNLDITLTDEVLQQLDIEDALYAEFGSLSINAIAGTEDGEVIRLRALVKNKVMLILVDIGSSNCFISADFVKKVGLPTRKTTPKQVKVANGDILLSAK